MSFTAWYYPFFLLIVVALFWQLPRRGRWALLLVASYVFYGYWDLRFLALIGASTVMDFLCGLAIAGQRKPLRTVMLLASLPVLWFASTPLWVPSQIDSFRWLAPAIAAAVGFVVIYEWLWRGATTRTATSQTKHSKTRHSQTKHPQTKHPQTKHPQTKPAQFGRRFLILQISYNLGLLLFFKYFNFFIDSARIALASLGLAGDFTVLQVLLPVGISFYTFQSIAYAVDIYRGKTEPVDQLLLFAAFIAFFPQLVAGPIERAQHILPQLRTPLRFEASFIQEGLALLLVGYFKKVFVANHCAMVADYLFKGSGQTSPGWVALGTLAFAFQIYGDFSGYTDIARGSARMFGVRLSQNFRFPYYARGPSDFWNRWHISLSSWIRDYLYIPLGGNRQGDWQTIRNLYLSMLLAGLWHGAAWNFVLWGAFHASLLTAYRWLPGFGRLERSRGGLQWLAVTIMFLFTLVGWLIFRAPSFAFMQAAMQSVTGQHAALETTSTLGPLLWVLIHVAPLLLLQWASWQGQDEVALGHRRWPMRAIDYLVLLLLVASSLALDQEFIYFQF